MSEASKNFFLCRGANRKFVVAAFKCEKLRLLLVPFVMQVMFCYVFVLLNFYWLWIWSEREIMCRRNRTHHTFVYISLQIFLSFSILRRLLGACNKSFFFFFLNEEDSESENWRLGWIYLMNCSDWNLFFARLQFFYKNVDYYRETCV